MIMTSHDMVIIHVRLSLKEFPYVGPDLEPLQNLNMCSIRSSMPDFVSKFQFLPPRKRRERPAPASPGADFPRDPDSWPAQEIPNS